MAEARDVKAGWPRELEVLGKARDELRTQIKAAQSEVREEWKKLETTWFGIESELKRVGEHSKEPVKDMASAAKSLMDELRRGYDRIKAQLKQAPAEPQERGPSP